MLPKYDHMTLHLLNTLADGDVHTLPTLLKKLSRTLTLEGLSGTEGPPKEELSFLAISLRRLRFCLQKARLIECLTRRRCRITESGLECLHTNPESIPALLLEQRFDSQEDCAARPGKLDKAKTLPVLKRAHGQEQNPEAFLKQNYDIVRQRLASKILEKCRQVSPAFFERVVLDVLRKMGYGAFRQDAGKTTQPSGDGGVDGYIHEDKLGLDVVYMQAKRWKNPVGRPELQAFAGSLEGFRGRKGIFITTSRFTREALDYVERISQRIALIDGPQLAELMLDYGVGTIDHAHFTIKRLDMDYFHEEHTAIG